NASAVFALRIRTVVGRTQTATVRPADGRGRARLPPPPHGVAGAAEDLLPAEDAQVAGQRSSRDRSRVTSRWSAEVVAGCSQLRKERHVQNAVLRPVRRGLPDRARWYAVG